MKKHIKVTEIHEILSNGGYICEKCANCSDSRTYNLFEKDSLSPTGSTLVGHITRRQFQGLVSRGLIEPTSARSDKYGNTIRFYETETPPTVP